MKEIISVVLSCCLLTFGLAVSGIAAVVDFTYTQTDAVTGSGSITGNIDLAPWGGSGVVTFTGALPTATVVQNDLNTGFPVPAQAVGFITTGSNGNPGGGVGVHLDLSGPPVTLTGIDGADTWTIDVPRVMSAGLARDITFTVFDDFPVTDVSGAYQLAGWPGDNGAGHRHTGDTETFVAFAPDNFTYAESGGLGSNADGDALGFTAGIRNNNDAPPNAPIFVDDITFAGALRTDDSTVTKNGEALPPPPVKPILFIGGGSQPTSGADSTAFAFLQDRYGADNVDYLQASSANTLDAAGRDLLVISSTPGSGDIRGKWDAVTVGIVNWEEAVSDDGGGEFRLADTITKATSDPVRFDITNTTHPITSGVGPGVVDFTTDNRETFYGNTLGPGVVSMGTQDTDPTMMAIMTADAGTELRGGWVSPNRRVMFPMTDNTFDGLSADGLALFGQATDWAMGAGPKTAATILLVTNNGGTSNSLAEFLVGRGHRVVSGQFGGGAPSQEFLDMNDIDLILVARESNSGDYDDGTEPQDWNALELPMINMNPYLYRDNRWGWQDGTSLPGATLTGFDDPLLDPNHPFLEGATTELFASGEGFTLAGSPLVADAEVIATLDGGSPGIFIIPEAVDLFNGRGTTGDVRVGFLRGNEASWDNILPNGELILGNMIDTLAPFQAEVIPEPSTRALAALGLLGLGVVGWRRRRK